MTQVKRLLEFFGIKPNRLATYKEAEIPLVRKPVCRPKREYCTLTWGIVQRICMISNETKPPDEDSIIGRAVLTVAFTTGVRVGGILPPNTEPKKTRIYQSRDQDYGG